MKSYLLYHQKHLHAGPDTFHLLFQFYIYGKLLKDLMGGSTFLMGLVDFK